MRTGNDEQNAAALPFRSQAGIGDRVRTGDRYRCTGTYQKEHYNAERFRPSPDEFHKYSSGFNAQSIRLVGMVLCEPLLEASGFRRGHMTASGERLSAIMLTSYEAELHSQAGRARRREPRRKTNLLQLEHAQQGGTATCYSKRLRVTDGNHATTNQP